MKTEKRVPLQPEEIEQALKGLPGWTGDQNGLKKKFTFRDFASAIRFMQACVEGINQRNHHPTWCNTYDSLEIRLNTHDAGNRVTRKDVELAEYLESVFREMEKAG